MKKRHIVLLILLMLVGTVLAVPRNWVRDRLGNFTGPQAGAEQDENVKASLDLAHSKLAAFYGSSGDVWFVDSATAGVAGTSWSTAVATLNDAITLAAANNSDLILIAANHSETLGSGADGVDVNKAGIIIVGLGVGENRPLFDYDSVGDEFVIGASNVSIYNLQFKSNVDSVLKAIDIETGNSNFIIENCRFYLESTGTDDFDDVIIINDNCDNGKIINCDFEMGAGTHNQSAINTDGTDYLLIKGNRFSGDFAVACIEDATTASIWITIQDNILMNGTVGGFGGLNTLAAITLKVDTSAMIINNQVFTNVATPDLAIIAEDGFLSGNTFNKTEGGQSQSEPLGLEMGRVYSVTMTSTLAAQSDDLFTVAGGAIEIVSLFGKITTAFSGTPGSMKIQTSAAAGANYDAVFTTDVNVDTGGLGDTIRFDSAMDFGVLDFTANAGAGQTLSWFCDAGVIEQITTNTATGVVVWYMSFRILEQGVTVTPM